MSRIALRTSTLMVLTAVFGGPTALAGQDVGIETDRLFTEIAELVPAPSPPSSGRRSPPLGLLVDPWAVLRSPPSPGPVPARAEGVLATFAADAIQDQDRRPPFDRLFGGALLGTIAGGALGGLVGGVIASETNDTDRYAALGGFVLGSTLGGIAGSTIGLRARQVDGHPSPGRSLFGSTVGSVLGWTTFISFAAADGDGALLGAPVAIAVQSAVSAWIARGSGG